MKCGQNRISPAFRIGSTVLAFVVLVFPLAVQSAEPHPDNRAIITRFADLFYRQKKVAEAFNDYVAPDYIQHNPGIADGRDAAVSALVTLFGMPDHTFNVEKVLVDGDFAAIHIRATSTTSAGTKVASVVDFYRLDHGRIVEHWDVIQLVPATSANPHPMF